MGVREFGMRNSGGRGAAVALSVAAALALAGCNQSTTPEPDPSATSSSVAPSSAAPSSAAAEPQWPTPEHPAQNLTPPELPAEAKEFTEEGFKAFIEHWFEVRNYGIATGDGKPVEALSDPGCPFCKTTLDMIANIANGGDEQWIVGGTMQTSEITAKLHGGVEASQRAYLTLRQISGSGYDKDGLIEEGEGVLEDWVEIFEFDAVYQDGAWKAVRIEVRE